MLYRTIVCATDGLEHSARALRRAAEIARESRAELHVVHVPEPELNVAMLRAGEFLGAMRSEREQTIRTQLRELADGEPPLDVVPHFLPDGSGSVAARIAALAERVDADLVVVGSRRRSALGGSVGSTSHRLPSVTRRPVLVLAGDGPDSRRRPRSRARSHRRHDVRWALPA